MPSWWVFLQIFAEIIGLAPGVDKTPIQKYMLIISLINHADHITAFILYNKYPEPQYLFCATHFARESSWEGLTKNRAFLHETNKMLLGCNM